MEFFDPIVRHIPFFFAPGRRGDRAPSFFSRAYVYKRSILAILAILNSVICFAADSSLDSALAALKTNNLKSKYEALPVIQASRNPAAAEALAQAALTERDVNFRLAVLDQLASLGVQRVVPTIATLLRSDNGVIRQRTAKVIGMLGGPAAEKALIDAANREKESEVKAALLQGISLCGSEQSVQALQTALNDPRPEVRANAVGALNRIPGKKSRKALERARGDKDKKIQKLAEDSLKKRPNE
jgi:HEAT repeat protein